MKIILYNNFTRTPKMLADMLKAAGHSAVASKWGRGRAALMVEAGRIGPQDVVINWGVKFEQPPHESSRRRMMNALAGLHKRAQMEALHGAGVRIPHTVDITGPNIDCHALVRKHIQSSGGAGVRVVRPGDYDGSDTEHIYQHLINKRAEFRVHVWQNEAICVTRKYPDETRRDHDPNIWNLERGYVQRTVTKIGELMDESLAYISVAATQALGYDFGAVDIAMGMDGALYVLEVNSAPSLIEERAQAYISKIAALNAPAQ